MSKKAVLATFHILFTVIYASFPMKTPRNVSLAMVVSNSIPAAFVETTVKGSPLSDIIITYSSSASRKK